MSPASTIDSTSTAPTTADIEALERAFQAPAVEPRPAVARPARIAPADVPDEPRAPWTVTELTVGALFAVFAIGAIVLVVISAAG
ncbi:MAG: hypothetical protein JWM98_1923 [Thermoleophilia bacterium]|nr:hypothetical protein [Thermoleophilia bacterium]